MNKTTKPGSRAVFDKGVALTPKDKLVTWLDSQKLDGAPRLLRLPIVLSRTELGFDIDDARAAGSEYHYKPEQPAADAGAPAGAGAGARATDRE